MLRKCLLVGLAMILMFSVLGAVSCGKAGIAGKYVNQLDPSGDSYIELRDDGTYTLESGVKAPAGVATGHSGRWRLEGDELILNGGFAIRAKIKGDTIVTENGVPWVKK